jgi:DNA-binding NarL/FixJ family response regulator
MIHILIADDHAMMRCGLRQLLSIAEDIRIDGEAANGSQVMEMLQKNQFDLVLLDLSMPGFSGLALIERIRMRFQKLPILVLSVCAEPQMVLRSIHAGATGYLTKDNEPEVLVTAIRRTASGQRFIDPHLAQQIVFDLDTPETPAALQQLTNREFHILRLLAQGKNVNEIADTLSISSQTVSTHKTRLMQKMNFRNNAELLRFGMMHRLNE